MHAIDSIWRMGKVVWWQGARESAYCDILVGLLTKYRDSIEYARREGSQSFVISASSNLNSWSRSYEKELAYRTSSKVSPRDYKYLVKEMSDEEYAVVKAKFEKFLGRPMSCGEGPPHECAIRQPVFDRLLANRRHPQQRIFRRASRLPSNHCRMIAPTD